MKNVKYCLTCVDEKDQITGVFPVFEKREDLYIYLGLIINKSSYLISIKYLLYFDAEFDDFNTWVVRALDKDATLCIFTEIDRTFKIKVRPVL